MRFRSAVGSFLRGVEHPRNHLQYVERKEAQQPPAESDERNIYRVSFELRGVLLLRNHLQHDEHHSIFPERLFAPLSS